MCSSFAGIIPLTVRIQSTVDLGTMFGGIIFFNSSFRMEVPKKGKRNGMKLQHMSREHTYTLQMSLPKTPFGSILPPLCISSLIPSGCEVPEN